MLSRKWVRVGLVAGAIAAALPGWCRDQEILSKVGDGSYFLSLR
jgi:hypothetical protein